MQGPLRLLSDLREARSENETRSCKMYERSASLLLLTPCVFTYTNLTRGADTQRLHRATLCALLCQQQTLCTDPPNPACTFVSATFRVGQNCVRTPYTTICMAIFLPAVYTCICAGFWLTLACFFCPCTRERTPRASHVQLHSLIALVQGSESVSQHGGVLAPRGRHCHTLSALEQALADNGVVHLLLKHVVEALAAQLQA